ncbi:MAG: NADH dehydrogenase ubiquinone Fe-S protein 4 [Alphaproteobacteria bacterium]
MYIKIYPAIKNASQSGQHRLQHWCLQVVGKRGQKPNAIIGWSGGNDAMAEIALEFADKPSAIAAAKNLGLPYQVMADTKQKNIAGKNYAENFSHRRKIPWTH